MSFFIGIRYGVLDDLEIDDDNDIKDMDIDVDDSFKPQMPPLTPADVDIQPSFGQVSSSLIPSFAGRLLTPAEGCGFSPIGNTNRIVGGTPAKNGEYRRFL